MKKQQKMDRFKPQKDLEKAHQKQMTESNTNLTAPISKKSTVSNEEATQIAEKLKNHKVSFYYYFIVVGPQNGQKSILRKFFFSPPNFFMGNFFWNKFL